MSTDLKEDEVKSVLQKTLGADADEDTIEYFCGMLMDMDGLNEEDLQENLAPFLESYGLVETEDDAAEMCNKLCGSLRKLGMKDEEEGGGAGAGGVELLDKVVQIRDTLLTDEEQAVLDSTAWGFDVRDSQRIDVFMFEQLYCCCIRKPQSSSIITKNKKRKAKNKKQ